MLHPRSFVFPAHRALLPLAVLLLCGCDARWPDYAGVMGAPPPAQAAAASVPQGLTQSSR